MTEPMRTKEWRFPREGVGVCSDGRLLVYEGKDRLILPAPAAAIWEDAEVRALLLRNLPLPAPTPPIPREAWLICGIEPEDHAEHVARDATGDTAMITNQTATKEQIREHYKKAGCSVRISEDGHVEFRWPNSPSWLEGRWVEEYRVDPEHRVYLT